MYEYLTVNVLGPVFFPSHKSVSEARHIDTLGADGWELVAVVKQGPENVAYFKREIEEDARLESTSDVQD